METRKLILEKSIILFEKNGYLKTSVEEIMISSEKGKGTFYNYFKSKEELLLAVLDYFLEKHDSGLEELAKDVKFLDLENGMRSTLMYFIDKISINKNLFSVIQELIYNDFSIRKEVEKKLEDFRDIEIKFLKENIIKKLKQKNSSAEEGLVINYILSSIHTFVIIITIEKKEYILKNKKRAVEDVLSLILHGIQNQ